MRLLSGNDTELFRYLLDNLLVFLCFCSDTAVNHNLDELRHRHFVGDTKLGHELRYDFLFICFNKRVHNYIFFPHFLHTRTFSFLATM